MAMREIWEKWVYKIKNSETGYPVGYLVTSILITSCASHNFRVRVRVRVRVSESLGLG